MRGLLSLGALWLAALPARAVVYQCQGADGSIVFSDSPCGADAKVIVVHPQAPLSNSTATTKRTPANANGAGRDGNASSESQDAAALRCQAREYLAWYKAQNPKPSREQTDEKMNDIVDSCWLSSHLQDASSRAAVNPDIKTVHFKAPQATAGTSGGMAASPSAPGAPLQVSRSRQPEEAARWSNYYACRTRGYQDGSNATGHPPDQPEAGVAMTEADSRCRAQFDIPAGTTAILVD